MLQPSKDLRRAPAIGGAVSGGGGGVGGCVGGVLAKQRRQGSAEMAHEATEAIELATLEEAVQRVSDACSRCEQVFEEEKNLVRFDRLGRLNSIRSKFEAGGSHKNEKEEYGFFLRASFVFYSAIKYPVRHSEVMLIS